MPLPAHRRQGHQSPKAPRERQPASPPPPLFPPPTTPTHPHKPRWSFPTDVWSLGCVIGELLYGKRVFPLCPTEPHLHLIAKLLSRPIPPPMLAFALAASPSIHPLLESAFPDGGSAGVGGAARQRGPGPGAGGVASTPPRLRAPAPALAATVAAGLTLDQLTADSPHAADLLRRLLEPDPTARTTARQALQHPYIVTSAAGRDSREPGPAGPATRTRRERQAPTDDLPDVYPLRTSHDGKGPAAAAVAEEDAEAVIVEEAGEAAAVADGNLRQRLATAWVGAVGKMRSGQFMAAASQMAWGLLGPVWSGMQGLWGIPRTDRPAPAHPGRA